MVALAVALMIVVKHYIPHANEMSQSQRRKILPKEQYYIILQVRITKIIARIVGRNMTTNGKRITSICKSQKITFQGTSNKEYLGVPRVYLIYSNAHFLDLFYTEIRFFMMIRFSLVYASVYHSMIAISQII